MLQKVDPKLIPSSINTLEEKVVIKVSKGENEINNCAVLQHRTGKKIHSLLIMGFTEIEHLIIKIHKNIQDIFPDKEDVIIEIFDQNLEGTDEKVFLDYTGKMQKEQLL